MVYFSSIKSSWIQCWANRLFRIHLAGTLMGYMLFLRFGIQYISLFELRHGRILADPVLQSLPPHDFSVYIFFLIHTGIVITIFRLLPYPTKLLLGMQACLAILVMRTFSIYLFPLEPPPGMITLKDPFLSLVFGSASNVAVKDLFFSGHVATMCVLFYFSATDYWKAYVGIATAIVALLIAWQHVHYTIDIIAAPFFGFAICKVLSQLHERLEYGLQYSSYDLDYEEAR